MNSACTDRVGTELMKLEFVLVQREIKSALTCNFRMTAPYLGGCIFVSWAVTWRAAVGTLKTDKGQVSPLTLPLEAWAWERLHFAGSVGDCGRGGRGELTCIVTFPSEIYPKEKMPSLWHKSPAFHQGLSQMEGQEQRGMRQRGRWGESSSPGGPNGCLTKLPMSCLSPAFPYVTNDIIFPGFKV